MINEENFTKMMVYLASSKKTKFEDVDFRVWYELLKHHDEGKLKKAFIQMIKSPDNFINIGKIEEFIRNEKDVDLVAANGWDHLMRLVDANERPDDNILKDTLMMFGDLNTLKKMDMVRDMPFIRREAIKYIKARLVQERKEKQLQIAESDVKLIGG
jgi:hypothetical protein